MRASDIARQTQSDGLFLRGLRKQQTLARNLAVASPIGGYNAEQGAMLSSGSLRKTLTIRPQMNTALRGRGVVL